MIAGKIEIFVWRRSFGKFGSKIFRKH